MKSLKRAVFPIEGDTLLTRIPRGEYSTASCLVIISTAPLLAPYQVRPEVGTSVMQELMFMMFPDSLAKKCGMTAFVAWKILLTFMSKTPGADFSELWC